MSRTADIVIIGAGIIGPSTAYYLSQGGIKNIVVIDEQSAGGQATKATAAMVMHQTGVETTTRLSKLSLEKYAHFHDTVGVTIDFNVVGSVVFTATETGEAVLTKQATMQNSLGVVTQVWDGSMISQKTGSFMEADKIKYGIYCATDGYINAQLAVQGYLARAKDKGTVVLENTRATKIIMKNYKVEAVETNNGELIHTNTVINCAGTWANDIAQSVGITIPIKASKKCLGIIRNRSSLVDFPIVEDFDEGWYFRPHSKGIMVGFGLGEWVEDEDREHPPRFNARKLKDLEAYVALRAPQLLPIMLVDGWAGYRPMIHPKYSDVLPIIGSVEGINGYYNNCGYGEFGITHAPIGGELLSQIILGKTPTIETAPFRLSRFKF